METKRKTIRWGIVGCGDVCEVKSGPAFYKCDGSELVAVMRRDAARAEDYARRHGVARWYSDAEALIADSEVDAVYVATPPGSHQELAMRVLAAGKPCYVEKPMSRNGAEGRRMVEAFERAGIPLFVAYYRRKLDRFLFAKEAIKSGRIGKVVGIRYELDGPQMKDRRGPVPWRMVPAVSGGGIFHDIGSHALDLIDFLLGPVEVLSAEARNIGGAYEAEDTVSMTFRAGGVEGSADWSFISDERRDSYTISCEKGELSFSCFGNEPVSLELSGEGNASVETNLPNPPHVHQPLVQEIVDVLRGAKPWDGVSGCPRAGLRTQVVMDEVLAGYNGQRGR